MLLEGDAAGPVTAAPPATPGGGAGASAAALRAVAIGAPTGPAPPIMGEPCRRAHCRGADPVRAIVLDCSRMADSEAEGEGMKGGS